MTLVPALLLSIACTDPAGTGVREGTFVGNPGLTARYLGTPAVEAGAGALDSDEIHLRGCDPADDVALGPTAFSFGVDGLSLDARQIPAAEYCSVFVVGKSLTVGYEGAEGPGWVTGDSFDLIVERPFTAGAGEAVQIQLGGDDWLDELASAAGPGEHDASEPGLSSVFFDGLLEDSTVRVFDAPEAEEVPGRVDLASYTTSPNGWPLVEAGSGQGCGPGVTYEMAIPVAEATMATLGLEGLGWCEGTIVFSDDLTPRTSQQVDHHAGTTYPVSYNGWGTQDCGELHCNALTDAAGAPVGACTLLVECTPGDGLATVTGYLL